MKKTYHTLPKTALFLCALVVFFYSQTGNSQEKIIGNQTITAITPIAVNMTPTYHNSTLASLATAVPAIEYTYAPYTNIKYRFSITNVTTGITAPDIIQTSRYVTIPVALHLYGAAYDIKASAVVNDEIMPFLGNTIRVNAPIIQLITLNSNLCGGTLAALSSTISANAGLNAISYTFRIRLNDTNPTPTYAYSQSTTRFVGANSFAGFPLRYNTSYKIAVKYTFIDPVTNLVVDAGYGDECVVNTPQIPVTSLASPICGSTVTGLNPAITAVAGPYATAYQFRIKLFSDNGPSPTYYFSQPVVSRFSSLSAIQGITIAYATEYAVSVRYSILNNGGTEWSNYGPECKIKTPFMPITSLVPTQCGLMTPTPLTQTLNITPYPGFPHYKVLLAEVSGEDVVNTQVKEIAYSYFKLNDFSIAQAGKNYNISVAVKINGAFGEYSTACDLFTAPLAKTISNEPFKAKAYPNPFADNFKLEMTTSSASKLNIKVYDMFGRLIEQQGATASEITSVTIGDNYASGVYNVVLSQDDTIQTLRVVKR